MSYIRKCFILKYLFFSFLIFIIMIIFSFVSLQVFNNIFLKTIETNAITSMMYNI